MKKIKTVIEVFILALVLIIALWLGAFLLRDKSELFCEMSFGEYRLIPSGRGATIPEIDASYRVCIKSKLIKFLGY